MAKEKIFAPSPDCSGEDWVHFWRDILDVLPGVNVDEVLEDLVDDEVPAAVVKACPYWACQAVARSLPTPGGGRGDALKWAYSVSGGEATGAVAAALAMILGGAPPLQEDEKPFLAEMLGRILVNASSGAEVAMARHLLQTIGRADVIRAAEEELEDRLFPPDWA